MIAIVDYKAGNLTSVKYAFDALGVQSCVTSSPSEILSAEKVVFPGVGAARSAMENLQSLDLVDVLKETALEKPFLGICLGMQILFDSTEEDGGTACLGIVHAKVRRFPSAEGCKIPQIGWNDVEEAGRSAGQKNEFYYFVHSYYADLCPETAGVTEYAGVRFSSMVKKGRLWACQFHPEKSGAAGLKLLSRWLKEA